MTSFRIESPASRRLKICEPPDWSRRNLDRPSGRLGGRSFDGNNSVAVAFPLRRAFLPPAARLFAPLEAPLPGRSRGAFLWARLRQPQDHVAVALALASNLPEPVDELGGEPDSDAVPMVGLWGQSVSAVRQGRLDGPIGLGRD
jgi:hypothetical protein